MNQNSQEMPGPRRMITPTSEHPLSYRRYKELQQLAIELNLPYNVEHRVLLALLIARTSGEEPTVRNILQKLKATQEKSQLIKLLVPSLNPTQAKMSQGNQARDESALENAMDATLPADDVVEMSNKKETTDDQDQTAEDEGPLAKKPRLRQYSLSNLCFPVDTDSSDDDDLIPVESHNTTPTSEMESTPATEVEPQSENLTGKDNKVDSKEVGFDATNDTLTGSNDVEKMSKDARILGLAKPIVLPMGTYVAVEQHTEEESSIFSIENPVVGGRANDNGHAAKEGLTVSVDIRKLDENNDPNDVIDVEEPLEMSTERNSDDSNTNRDSYTDSMTGSNDEQLENEDGAGAVGENPVDNEDKATQT